MKITSRLIGGVSIQGSPAGFHWAFKSSPQPVQHTCVGKLGQHWFRWWLVTSSAPSHYLNQCKNIVNLTMRNNIQLNLNQNVSFMKCIRKCCQGNVWVNKAAKWNTDVLEAVIYGQLVFELVFIDKITWAWHFRWNGCLNTILYIYHIM